MVFNILSIILGILAMVMPIISMSVKSGLEYKGACISLSSCVLSIYCQIAEYNSRINQQDFSALLDTSSFITGISAALVIIVLLLNLIMFKLNDKK